MNDDVRIIRRIGIISDGENGWQKELNIVSVNDGPFQYDLREWSLDHGRSRNGISFDNSEATVLLAVLKDCFKDGGEGISLDQFPEALSGGYAQGQMHLAFDEESDGSSEDEALLEYLRSENIDYADKRSKGGALWITGGHELDSLMVTCAEMGFKFFFSEKGGKVTKGAAGWYLPAKRRAE